MDYLKKFMACFMLWSNMLLASDAPEYLERLSSYAKKQVNEVLDKEDKDRFMLSYGAIEARLKSKDILDKLVKIQQYVNHTPKNLFKISLIYRFIGEDKKYKSLSHHVLSYLNKNKISSIVRDNLFKSLENFAKNLLWGSDFSSLELRNIFDNLFDLETLALRVKEKYQKAKNKEDQDRLLLIYGATKARLKSQDIVDELSKIKEEIAPSFKNLLKISLIYKFIGENETYKYFLYQVLASLDKKNTDSHERFELGKSLEHFAKDFLGSSQWLSDNLKNNLGDSLEDLLDRLASRIKSPPCARKIFLIPDQELNILSQYDIKGINKLKIGLLNYVLGNKDLASPLIDNLQNYQDYSGKDLVLQINSFAMKLGLTTKNEWIPLMIELKKNMKKPINSKVLIHISRMLEPIQKASSS